MRCYLIILVTFFMFSACSRTERIIHPDLQYLLNYYRDLDANEYKQRAAQFLIDNMDAHYTLQSEGIVCIHIVYGQHISLATA